MDTAALRVRVNGTSCPQVADVPRTGPPSTSPHGHVRFLADVAPRLLQFTVKAAALARGYNEIDVELASAETQKVIWVEFCLSPVQGDDDINRRASRTQ